MLTTRFLSVAVRHAAKGMQIQHRLTEDFIQRYGVTYSDIDADALIDLFDYEGGDSLTLEECDAIMTEAGHPPQTGRLALSSKEARDG